MRILNLIIISLLFPVIAFSQDFDFSPDRPGMATGPGVMRKGKVMWETGLEGTRTDGLWAVTTPTMMLRAGFSDFAEVRLQYDGTLAWGAQSMEYAVEPFTLGTKLRILDGNGRLPDMAFLANLTFPFTSALRSKMAVAPSMYLLFQNDVCDWFNIGYNIGAEWDGVAANPDIFLAVCLGFAPSDKIGLFLENHDCIGKSYCFDAGISLMIAPKVQFDLYAGLDLLNPKAMTLVGGGIAWLMN